MKMDLLDRPCRDFPSLNIINFDELGHRKLRQSQSSNFEIW